MNIQSPIQDNIAASLLLETIFHWFDENAYEYCVQRNYQGYPERLTGDIDLVIAFGMMDQIVDGILDVANNLGWSCYFTHTWKKTSFLGLCKPIYPSRYTLTLELFAGAGWHGISYLSSSLILANRTRFGITWKPLPTHQAIMTFIHHLLYNGHVPPKYRDEIRHLVDDNPKLFQNLLSNSFGNSLGHISYDAIIKENWDEFSNHVLRFKFNTLLRATKKPILFTTNIIDGYNVSRIIPKGIILIINSSESKQSHELSHAMLKLANKWHIFYPPYRKIFNLKSENHNKFKKQIRRIIDRGGVCIVNCGNLFDFELELSYPIYSIQFSDNGLSIRSICDKQVCSLTNIDWKRYQTEQIAHKLWNDLLNDWAHRYGLGHNYIHG